MIENIITLVLLNKLFRCVNMYELLLRLCMTGIVLLKENCGILELYMYSEIIILIICENYLGVLEGVTIVVSEHSRSLRPES